jgi:hypothetical protein
MRSPADSGRPTDYFFRMKSKPEAQSAGLPESAGKSSHQNTNQELS